MLSSSNFFYKNRQLNLSIQPTFDSPTPIPVQKVFPQYNVSAGESQQSRHYFCAVCNKDSPVIW
jgi:hypothetical protein